jgi:hypothetical protein
MDRFNLKVSSRFVDLENLDDDVDNYRYWETSLGNINISAKERLGYCEAK